MSERNLACFSRRASSPGETNTAGKQLYGTDEMQAGKAGAMGRGARVREQPGRTCGTT